MTMIRHAIPVAVLLALTLPLSGCAVDAMPAAKQPTQGVPSASASSPRTTTASESSLPEPSETAADRAPAMKGWNHQEISQATLETAGGTRWYFAHMSVGGNVLKGVKALYEAEGLEAPEQVYLDKGGLLPEGGGFVASSHIGRNGHPLDKLSNFDAALRGGLADDIDVAVLKFCYADVWSRGDDPDHLFKEYQRVLGGLERDYPDVTFLYATVPLKAEAPADNAARTRYNELVRAKYAKTGRLWDIAAVESTTLEGEQISGIFDGEPYQALYPGYTRDGAHLYDLGAEVAAAPLLELIAKSTR